MGMVIPSIVDTVNGAVIFRVLFVYDLHIIAQMIGLPMQRHLRRFVMSCVSVAAFAIVLVDLIYYC